jgi:hypothetical protein
MDAASHVPDLEVELELHYEIEPYEGPEPIHAAAYDPWLEVDMELIDDDLVDPWFHLDESAPVALPEGDEVFEIDPVHPLRRLGSWVRSGFRKAAA